ncbi:unnamed protein product [Trichobilharzia regenti]|nr:unnamed protein product [Trichobilharzia regenti]
MMPSSPSIISNHGKYSPSNRLTSPRPASLSPPVNNVSHHHTRSIPPPPPPRRLGLSPNSNHSPGPSCANHQSINNNNIGNSNNNNSWSSQSPYLFKSPPSTSQQYLNHCSPSSSSSSISPVPFHNSLNTNHVYLKPQQHMPYSNSPYSSACSLHTHNSNCGGSTINGNSTAMMHPVHYNNRALLTSPTPGGNRSLSARPLPSPGSGGGDSFPGVGGETDMMNCGLISPNCPCHTADIGWIGLPGRPVICLVECLLDAAAIVVEAANHHHQAPPIIALPAWGHMEKASFYLCLAVKVSLLALFQQRPPVGSVSRLLACQHQEARLLTLLNTIPKDVTIALAMCDTLCQLLGPPISSSRCLGRLDHSPVVRLWWWSALGFLVHPDTYPVHAVAEFVLNYLLDTQRLNQLSSFTTCWSGYANGSNNNNHMSSVRIDDMVFTLVIRAMRFSIPENYMMDTSATGPGLMRSNSSPQLSMGGGSSGGGVSQRTHYNYRGWGDHFNNGNNNNHLSGSSSGGHIIPAGVRSGLETALAVNTDQVSDQEFTSMTTPSMITSTAGGDPGNFDHHQRYSYLPTNNNNNNANPLFHWEHQHHQQSSAPEGGGDRFLMTTPKISSPPLPSAFAISTQNFLKSVNGTVNMNSPTSSSSSRNLCDHQAYVDNCRWSVPPVIMPSIDDHGGGEVVTPFSGLAPLFTIMRNNIRIRRNRFSSTILDDNHQTFNSTGSGNDTLKIRQSRLAVALIRVSKSLIHRLDQIVQICDQNIDSPVTLLVISQQPAKPGLSEWTEDVRLLCVSDHRCPHRIACVRGMASSRE